MSVGDISTIARRRFLQSPTNIPLRLVLTSRAHLFIKEQYQTCVKAFEQTFGDYANGDAHDDMHEVFENFTFWGVEYGASNGSLDRTLEKSTSLRGFVIEILSNIVETLKESPQNQQLPEAPMNDGVESTENSDSENDVESEVTDPSVQRKLKLNESINRLYDLAPALTAPAPLDDINQKANGFRDMLESDIKFAKSQFPNADASLCERIGTANWLRRNRLYAWRIEYDSLTRGGKYNDKAIDGEHSDSDDGEDISTVIEASAGLPFRWIGSDAQNTFNDDASSTASGKSGQEQTLIKDPNESGSWMTAEAFDCPICFQRLTRVHTRPEWL